MSGVSSMEPDSLPPSLGRFVDEVCCRFEEAWQEGRRPRIEEHLQGTPTEAQAFLLRELVRLDVHYRRQAGDALRPEGYQERFPTLDGRWLAEVLSGASPAPAVQAPPGDQQLRTAALPVTRVRHIRCPHCSNPIQLVVEERPGEVFCPGCGSSFRPEESESTQAPAADPASQERFQLLDRVGLGAFGTVWRARDTKLQRIVALKIPHAGQLNSPADLERFFREARSAAQLRHPGIVSVHEVTTINDTPAIVADFVEGVTLRDLADMRRLAFRETAALVAEVADALEHAHQQGIVHRDVKPGNIMVEYRRPAADDALASPNGSARRVGKPLLTDFGLALRGEAEIAVTMDGQIVGTPAYMSPEQAAGRSHQVDGRSDVYSLGVVLYEMLCGTLPFRGSKLMMVHQLLHEEPRPPRRIHHQVPRDLETICLKAMAKQPAQRYARAAAFAEDLRRWLNGEPIQARPVGALRRGLMWARRRPLIAALLAAIVVSITLGVAGVTWQWRQTVAALEDLKATQQDRDEALVKATRAELDSERDRQQAEASRRAVQARDDVKEFRRLVDAVQFHAAATNPIGEVAPYFDPQKGEQAGRAALALAGKWGPSLDQLALPDERPLLQQEIYELLLLLVQARSQRVADTGALRECLALLEQARTLVPRPSRSYHRLSAHCYRLLGDDQLAAREQRQAATAAKPTTALDHFLHGEDYRTEALRQAESERTTWQPSRDLLTRAVEEYRQALQLLPSHGWSHFQLSRCYLGLGQGAEALAALSAFVALRPDSPWGYSARGLVLALFRRFPEAERDLDRAIKLDPDFRPARVNRGVAYWQQKKFAQALADFEFVLQPPAEKQLLEAAYYRGQLQLERGDAPAALEDLNRVTAANPGFRAAYLLRAQVYLLRGEDARTLNDLDAFLAGGRPFDSRSRAAHEERGRLLRNLILRLKLSASDRRKRLELALQELTRAVDLGGRSAALFADLGSVHELLGRADAAIAAYTQGLKGAPDDIGLLVKRGWVHANREQYPEALADFTRAVRADPRHVEACTGLGYVQACQGAGPRAQRLAAQALLHGGGDYLVLHNTACIYGKLSQVDAAQATEYQDAAMELLRQAVELWQRGGAGPDELDLIRKETAFPPALRDREDFRKLVEGGRP